MKLFIVYIIVVICSLTTYSQGFIYAGAGYNASILKSEGLDFIVDRYNSTRPYLDEKMGYPHYYDGLSLHVGGADNKIFWDFGFTGKSSLVSASGIDATGMLIQRDVKNKWNSFDFGFGFNLGSRVNKGYMLGINTAINGEKSYTRFDTPENINKNNFTKVNKKFKIGFEPFFQYLIANDNGVGILIKPYYSWTPFKTDYTALNAAINPNTYYNDPIPVEGKLSGFGLSILLISYTKN